MEKLAFALVTAARKLKPHFQAHIVIVLTNKHLQRAMSNPKAAGQMALWAIELREFDIKYRPRTTIKGQIIADFIVEFTLAEDQGVEESPQWSIHIDGSSNRQLDGVGMVLYGLEGDRVKCVIRLDFPTTNNEAEYETLIARLDLAKAVGAKSVVVYCNSQVVIS